MTTEERFIELESKARSHDVAIDLLISMAARSWSSLKARRTDLRYIWVLKAK